MASPPRRTQRARLAALTERSRQKVRRREELRDKAKIAASIRAALTGTDFDPARITVWWTIRDAAAELLRLGDTPVLRAADAAVLAQHPQLASRDDFAAEAERRAARFAGRPPPSPGASLLDWYAWSLAAARLVMSQA